MHEQFPVDLKVARRKSGLSQADCAHLLGVDPSVMSKLEAGKAVPSVTQLTILHLVFGDGARSLWSGLVVSLQDDLAQRLASMPKCPTNWPDQFNRQQTLDALAERLDSAQTRDHD
ncbi:MAG: helix-turn-helix transcriptional regulator [Devosia sp.]